MATDMWAYHEGVQYAAMAWAGLSNQLPSIMDMPTSTALVYLSAMLHSGEA